jgi:hypothetical protein
MTLPRFLPLSSPLIFPGISFLQQLWHAIYYEDLIVSLCPTVIYSSAKCSSNLLIKLYFWLILSTELFTIV